MVAPQATPEVSIVIPFYNQGVYLYEAVLSAKLASRRAIEIIIVNDGSTEPHVQQTLARIVEEIADDRCTVRVIHQANGGLSAARNAGIAAARGAFLQLLDSDDILVADKIDDQLVHFDLTDDLDVSVTDFVEGNDTLDRFTRYAGVVGGFGFTTEDFAIHWERGFSVPIHCALFRRSIFDETKFDTNVGAKEDWIFWTRLATRECRIAYFGSLSVIYRIHPKSMVRSEPTVGRDWLKAALTIDDMLDGKHPHFLSRAVDWFRHAYSTSGSNAPAAADRGKTLAEKPQPTKSLPAIRRPTGPAARPAISLVVPVFNHFDYLQRCIDSILAQDQSKLEVILVDDASTDPRVRDILASLSGRANIKVLFNPENRGIARTQNAAVAAAAGEYVAFLDCDDELEDDAIATALDWISTNGGCDYFFSDLWDVDPLGKRLRLARYGGYRDDRFTGDIQRDLVNGMVATHLKIVRKSSFDKAGGFDSRFSGVQDWELALKIGAFGTFLYLPEPLYRRRVHAKSVTQSDHRRQFQSTNMVRRRYAPLALNVPQDRPPESLRVSGNDALTPRSLMAAWEQSPVAIDATRPLGLDSLWLLREFNSYVDQIFWSAPEVYASLLGYVWSPEILRRVS